VEQKILLTFFFILRAYQFKHKQKLVVAELLIPKYTTSWTRLFTQQERDFSLSFSR